MCAYFLAEAAIHGYGGRRGVQSQETIGVEVSWKEEATTHETEIGIEDKEIKVTIQIQPELSFPTAVVNHSAVAEFDSQDTEEWGKSDPGPQFKWGKSDTAHPCWSFAGGKLMEPHLQI